MSSPNDDTILPPRRPVNSGGLDGDTVLPSQNAPGIHVPGVVIDNRYTVIREIGRGGMGVVYEVEDQITTERYAIKRLLPESAANDQLVRAFVREGTAAEKFSTSSGYFVTTKTVGRDTFGFYSVMELVTMPTLRQVLTVSGRVEPATAIPILLQLASALSALHGAGLIHRDLKPENIFVADAASDPSVKLVDFGLTREITSHTVTGLAGAGSLRYMAPELLRNEPEPANKASDVFAFGVIAYELMTGEPPIGMAQPVQNIVPEISSIWADLIAACLSYAKEKRPPVASIIAAGKGPDRLSENHPSAAVTGSPRQGVNGDQLATMLSLDVQDGSIVEVNGRPLAAPYRFSMHADPGTKTVIDVQVMWQKFSVFHGQVTLKAGQNQSLRMERAVHLTGKLPDWCTARTAQGPLTLPLVGLAKELGFIELLHNDRVFKRMELSDLYGDVRVSPNYALTHICCDLPDIVRVYSHRNDMLQFPCSFPVTSTGETITLRFACDGLTDFEQTFSFTPGDIWLHPLLGNEVLADEIVEAWSTVLFPSLNRKIQTDGTAPGTVMFSTNTVGLSGTLPGWCTARTNLGTLTPPFIGLARELEFVEFLHNNRVFERMDVSDASGNIKFATNYDLAHVMFKLPNTASVYDDQGEPLARQISIPVLKIGQRLQFECRASGLPTLKFSVDFSPGRRNIEPLIRADPVEGSIRSAWRRLCYPELSTYLDSICSIPSGRFEMGGNKYDKEQPVHPVQVSAFRLAATPVTVGIWREYCMATGTGMPSAPKWGWLDDHPIVNVSWDDIMGADGTGGFCAWASEVAGFRVSLPTEAQWEYACRGGQSGLEYPWGNQFDQTKLWCSKDESGDAERTAPVVRNANIYRNEFGLTDMVGNVWEWCLDYHRDSYLVPSTTKVVQRHRSVRASGIAGVLGKLVDETFEEQVTEYIEVSDPSGPTVGKVRCVRGGSWFFSNPDYFRCANRFRYVPVNWFSSLGFRLSAGLG